MSIEEIIEAYNEMPYWDKEKVRKGIKVSDFFEDNCHEVTLSDFSLWEVTREFDSYELLDEMCTDDIVGYVVNDKSLTDDVLDAVDDERLVTALVDKSKTAADALDAIDKLYHDDIVEWFWNKPEFMRPESEWKKLEADIK